MGTDMALWVTGLILGASHSVLILKPILAGHRLGRVDSTVSAQSLAYPTRECETCDVDEAQAGGVDSNGTGLGFWNDNLTWREESQPCIEFLVPAASQEIPAR